VNGSQCSVTKQASAGLKLLQVKKEALIQSSKRQPAYQATTKATFSNAVAFASGSTKIKVNNSIQKSLVMELPGNKRMRVPNDVVKGAGPRQLASKWKKNKPNVP
jgi:hypothetical protein